MSKPRFNIEFVKSDRPINDLVTKFGGQPTWMTEPEWPVSRSTNYPMRFICQISLSDLTLEAPYDSGMAYLFMTDTEIEIDGQLYGVHDQFEPEGGENAVILQPSGEKLVDTSLLAKGPSLLPKKAMFWSREQVDALCEVEEYEVRLKFSEDPDFVSIDDLIGLPDSQHQQYCDSLSGNKLGGVPGFIQPDEFPFPRDRSELLLQLDSGKVPFYVDFGDIGEGSP